MRLTFNYKCEGCWFAQYRIAGTWYGHIKWCNFRDKRKERNDCNQLTERNDWPTAKSRKTSTSHWTTKTLNSSPNQLRIILNDSVKVTMEIRIHLWNIYKTIEINIHWSISIDILILIKIFPFLIKLNVMISSWWTHNWNSINDQVKWSYVKSINH